MDGKAFGPSAVSVVGSSPIVDSISDVISSFMEVGSVTIISQFGPVYPKSGSVNKFL